MGGSNCLGGTESVKRVSSNLTHSMPQGEGILSISPLDSILNEASVYTTKWIQCCNNKQEDTSNKCLLLHVAMCSHGSPLQGALYCECISLQTFPPFVQTLGVRFLCLEVLESKIRSKRRKHPERRRQQEHLPGQTLPGASRECVPGHRTTCQGYRPPNSSFFPKTKRGHRAVAEQ